MKKKLFGLLTIIMMFALALGLVACGGEEIPAPDAETWTVTFVNGEQTVKTSSVAKGSALAEADFPEDPDAPAGQKFDGWFVGETEVVVGFEPTANITANAKFSDVGDEPDEPAEYTVTFVVNGDTVKTVTVEDGNSLTAADFPEDPSAPAGQKFDGWFVGEDEIEVGYRPSASVTVTASFSDVGGDEPDEPTEYTITFVVEGGNTTTVTVEEGQTPDPDELPSDPDKPHYTFEGWFDAEDNEFDESAAVTASATYTAKFTKTDYLVTFTQEGQENKEVWVTPSSGKLGNLPANEPVDGSVFLGWYSDGEKATADTDISGDATFHAVFVSQADYTGVWYNDEDHIQLYFGSDNNIHFGKETFGAGTYSAEDGTLGYDTGSYYTDKWTFLVVENTMTATHNYWDDVYEEITSDTYTLTKAEEGFALAGTYRKSSGSYSYLEISDGGIVTYFNTTVYYGHVVAAGDAYTVDLYSSESSYKTLNITLDAKGNLLITGDGADNGNKGIFVKNSSNDTFDSFDHEVEEYLYIHTVDGEKVYVYSVDETNTYYYVTVDGDLEVGEIVTLTKEDDPSVTHLIKIVADGDFVFAGEERGTYTLADHDSLVLDGFGSATLGEAEPAEYYIVGNKVVADDKGYEINIDEGTYTELVKESGNHVGTFTNISSSSYTAILDGYGIVITKAYSYVYYGTYTIEGTTLTVAGVDGGRLYLANGTYTLAEDEKVIYNEEETTVFAKADYTLYSKLNVFTGDHEGYWTKDGGDGEFIEITVDGNAISKLTYNGSVVTSSYYTVRYDGTSIKISSYSLDLQVKLTVEKDGKLHVVSTDDGAINDTYTSAAKPVTEKDAFAGGWVGKAPQSSSKDSTFWFDGFGNGMKIDDTSYTEINYTVKGNTIEFTLGENEYSLELKGEKLEGHFEYDYEEYPVSLSKGAPDKFEGVWNSGNEEMSSYRFTVTGYGYVLVKDMEGSYEEFVKYTISGEDIEFSADGYDFTCTLQEDGSMSVNGDLYDDPYIAKCPYTREGGAAGGGDLDALAGTWTFGSYTFEFDGKGKVTITDTYGSETVDYEFDGTNISFNYDSEDWTGTYADGKITLSDEYGDSFGYNHELQKQS